MATRPTPLRAIAHHDGKSWTTTWYDDGGRRRTKRFGKEGDISRRHATTRYQNWLANEWTAKEIVRNPAGDAACYRVETLAQDYLAHARTLYVKAGRPTSHLAQVKLAMDQLKGALGAAAAATVTAPQIAALRDRMIESGGRTLARGTVNDRLRIIQQAFSWAHAEKGKVPAQVGWAVSQVAALRQGRSTARERECVPPVSAETVEATLPHCSLIVADMVRLQWLAGMRPEEVCLLRGCDLEAGGDVWVYRPAHHKTEHHGKTREICLGPKAQEIIKRRLKGDTAAWLFTPAEAMDEWQAKSGQKQDRSRLTAAYSTRSYRQAIHRACNRAFDPDRQKRRRGDVSHQWNPNQLRHAWATAVRRRFGVEASKIGLGHGDIRTAEIYAERDLEKAMDVARKVG